MATLAPPVESRTLMASVVCADLVGFSKKNVADQIEVKETLSRHLQSQLAPIAPDGRLVLDTGDGVAVAFLGDPEHAMYFALRLRLDLRRNALEGLRPEDLRLGINLGPVKKGVDLNGYVNLLGEGMNSAERIMSFAAPGDTTTSRSFRDAVQCLRADYESLFEPLGRHTDKHGREHEVFRMLTTASAARSAGLSLDGLAGTDPPPTPSRAEDAAVARRSGIRAWVLLGGLAAAVLATAGIALFPSGSPPVSASAPVTAPPAGPRVLDAKPVETRPVEARPPETRAEPAPPQPEPVATASEPAKVVVEEPAKASPAAAPRPPKAERSSSGAPPSQQCSLLLQRAAVGELRPAELEELKKCR